MIKLFTQNRNDHQNKRHKHLLPTIIVSRSVVRRQSLRSRLAAHPNVWVIAAVGDGPSALTKVEQHRPGLLFIDNNLISLELEWLLGAVKAKAPQTRCLLCIETSHNEAWSRPANADAVIPCDSSGPEWEETLLRLTQSAA